MKRSFLVSTVVTRLTLVAAIFMMGLSGCQKDLYEPKAEDEKDATIKDFFNYESTQDMETAISYDVVNGYKVRFEVYDANPMTTTEDGQVVKKADLKAIAVGTTDENGSYNGTFRLPSSMTTAYVYSSDAGVPLLLEVPVTAGVIKATAAQAIFPVIQTRANNLFKNVTSATPFSTLAANGIGLTWNSSNGAIINEDQAEHSKFSKMLPSIYNAVNAVLAENEQPKNLVMGSGDYSTDLKTKDGKVYLRYICGKSSSTGTLVYYCYPNDATLTADYIFSLKKCVVFANTSSPSFYGNNDGVLKDGTCVELKYIAPDGTSGGQFPKGTHIGFALYNNGYRQGSGNANNRFNTNDPFYSTPVASQSRNMGRTATFTYANLEKEDITVVGFEDWTGDNGDYNDVVFNVTGVESTIVVDKKTVEYAGATSKGVLGFEDNWPNEGDYDLNDVVVKYSSTPTYSKTTNLSNSTITYSKVKVVDDFYLSWTGASFKNGFGYEVQLGDDVKSISITRDGVAVPNPQIEKGADGTSVIMLFHDARQELGVSDYAVEDIPVTVAPVHYAVTVAYKETELATAPTFVKAPYNPFITVMGSRAREVHLIDHKPTSKADRTLLGTGLDKSDGVSSFYRNADYWPFAINMDASGSTNSDAWNIDLKPEKLRIDKTYPKFVDWANSKGTNYKDWWKKN